MPNYQSSDMAFEKKKRPVGLSISVKLFGFLALFTLFNLIVVWTLQIGLLDYFYRQTKYQELELTDKTYVDILREDPDGLEQVVNNFSTQYVICTRIFRLEEDRVYPVVSVDVSGDCLVHHISDKLTLILLTHKNVLQRPVRSHLWCAVDQKTACTRL